MYTRVVCILAVLLHFLTIKAQAAELSLNVLGSVGMGHVRLVRELQPNTKQSVKGWEPRPALSGQLELAVFPFLGVVVGAGSQYAFEGSVGSSSRDGTRAKYHGFAPFWEAGMLQRLGHWHIQETVGYGINLANNGEEGSARVRVMHEIANLVIVGYEARVFGGRDFIGSTEREIFGADHALVLGIAF